MFRVHSIDRFFYYYFIFIFFNDANLKLFEIFLVNCQKFNVLNYQIKINCSMLYSFHRHFHGSLVYNCVRDRCKCTVRIAKTCVSFVYLFIFFSISFPYCLVIYYLEFNLVICIFSGLTNQLRRCSGVYIWELKKSPCTHLVWIILRELKKKSMRYSTLPETNSNGYWKKCIIIFSY